MRTGGVRSARRLSKYGARTAAGRRDLLEFLSCPHQRDLVRHWPREVFDLFAASDGGGTARQERHCLCRDGSRHHSELGLGAQ